MERHAAIVGAGVIGCAIALELRRRGFAVSVIDKNGDAGHGSTSASCGIVRRFYSQPGMIAMANEAAHVWADWAAHLGPVGEDLAVFRRPGVLFIVPRVDAAVHTLLAEMRRLGIGVALLTPGRCASASRTSTPRRTSRRGRCRSRIPGAERASDRGGDLRGGLGLRGLAGRRHQQPAARRRT